MYFLYCIDFSCYEQPQILFLKKCNVNTLRLFREFVGLLKQSEPKVEKAIQSMRPVKPTKARQRNYQTLIIDNCRVRGLDNKIILRRRKWGEECSKIRGLGSAKSKDISRLPQIQQAVRPGLRPALCHVRPHVATQNKRHTKPATN